MQGILFIEPLYHQMKIDKKNQTRRTGGLDAVNSTDPDNWDLTSGTFFNGNGRIAIVFRNKIDGTNQMCQAKYIPGETLYLKEPLHIHPFSEEVLYKYDNKNPEVKRWSNKLFMGQKHAREFIRITRVSLHRLLDIDDRDCIGEGIESSVLGGKISYKDYMGRTRFSTVETPKESFLSLYELANKGSKSPKVNNPWCWKYEFYRETPLS